MKWAVYTNGHTKNGFRVNIITKIGKEDMTGWELVAETKTKEEARKIFYSIGGSFF